MMVQTARVALENASLQYDRLYSYRVPEGMSLLAGCRVTVPFGAGNRTRLGIAMEVSQEEGEGLKSLSSVVDTAPLLNGELLGLARWLRENTFCCYFAIYTNPKFTKNFRHIRFAKRNMCSNCR